MQTARHIETRPFRDEDRSPINDIMNRDAPAHRRHSVAGWKSHDAMRLLHAVSLRGAVGDPAYAYMEVVDLNTTPWTLKDVCAFDIVVAHEHRRRGIGRALYEKLSEFARERGAKRLTCEFFAWTEDEPALAFLQKKGFAEMEREQAAYLDLAAFDPNPFHAALERAARAGARFITYADVEDTEENRRRIYALLTALIHEVPRRDAQPTTPSSFDDFSRRWFERPEYTPSLIRLAEVDGEWVGLTSVAPKQGSTAGMQRLTGVLPAYQGRGIATALKVESYSAAKRHGITMITTENHVDNGPMLAINQKFGFLPDAPLLVYNKVLEKEAVHADRTESGDGRDPAVSRRRPRADP